MKIRVITLFSGYDSQCLALNRLGIDYDLVAWCEIDKHAIKAHDTLFPQFAGRNLGDVSKVDWHSIEGPIDLLTYSSPCQDFSNAGLQRGGEEGSGTRSGLLWEVEKAIDALRPKYLVFENVASLVGEKFLPTFNRWQLRLQGYGYTNFCQVMNAKDYGVPQNRQRIFMVSIRDCERAYYFPKPFKLERRLKDVLEQNVEERYYLKQEVVEKLFLSNVELKNKGCGFEFKPAPPPYNITAKAVTAGSSWRRDDNFIVSPPPPISKRQSTKYYTMTNNGTIEARDSETGHRHTEEVYVNPESISPTVISTRPPIIYSNEQKACNNSEESD